MDQDLLYDNLEQLYVYYKDLEQWSDEQLQTRKEELQHLLWQTSVMLNEPIPFKNPKQPGQSSGYNPIWMSLSGMWHDVDEEEDARAYYAEHPSPTRAEFNAQRP